MSVFYSLNEGWGFILGYPTILLPGLENKRGNSTQPEFLLTENEKSWIGSINLLCVPLGSLTSGLLMDKLGKRRMMQVRMDEIYIFFRLIVVKLWRENDENPKRVRNFE